MSVQCSDVERAVLDAFARGAPLKRLSRQDAATLCGSNFLEFTLKKRAEVIELDTVKIRVRGRPYRAEVVRDLLEGLDTWRSTSWAANSFDIEPIRVRHLLLFLLDTGLVERSLDASNLETWRAK